MSRTAMHDPRVPETLEGWSVLHQMFRVRWDPWAALAGTERTARAGESAATLAELSPGTADASGATDLATLLGHKGDLMLIHFRRDLEALQQADLLVSRLPITPFLEATSSYVSIVELGMYEMTAQIHERLRGKGLTAGSDEFDHAFDAEME